MNVIVKTNHLLDTDKETLFGEEDVHYCYHGMLPNLLVELGLYKSTSQARRSGRVGSIPKGWTEMKGNKRNKLWIWNPFL